MSNLKASRRVLVVDNDRATCELINDYLAAEHFEVETVNESMRGLERALVGVHGVVVLNMTMPQMSGIEVLGRLRATSQIPVLFLTGHGSEVDRIVGLELGADDCLVKPINPRELVARVRAILRRSQAPRRRPTESTLIGELRIVPGSREVFSGDHRIPLTALEYDILIMLTSNAGHIVTRDALVRKTLGRDLSPLDRSIDTHISHLRKKLGRADLIKTVRGTGWLFVA